MLDRLNLTREPFKKKLIWYIIISSVISIIFILLQCRYPYYFYQDDNRSFFLPMYVHNYRSIINGEFPVFNFHQFLGISILGNSQSGALYPFTYISVFLSQVIFGQYFEAIDIYVYLHLITAGISFFILLISLGLDERSAFFGAITWPLTSFIVYVSNSWVFIVAFAAIFPLTIYSGIRLYRKTSLGNLIRLVLCQTLLFYIGSPQYFIYSVIFEFATLLALMAFSGNIKDLFRAIKYILLSYVYTIVLCLPLLLPSWYQMTVSATRSSNLMYEDYLGIYYTIPLLINSLITPFKRTASTFMHLSDLGYVGYSTLIVFLCSFRAFWSKKVSKTKRYYLIMFYMFCIVAYTWAMHSPIARVLYFVPILNRFRSIVKLVFFANFYVVIIAAFGVHVLLSSKYKKLNNTVFVMLIAINVAGFCYLYLFTPQQVFGMYRERIPKQDTIDYMFGTDRIATLWFGINNQFRDDIIDFNFATFRGLYHFAGYNDPLMLESNNKATLELGYHGIYFPYDDEFPLEYFREWGVKWYITGVPGIPTKYNEHLQLKCEDGKRKIYYDAKARPMLYWGNSLRDEYIDYEIKVNFIKANVNKSADGILIINFLYNPFFRAFIDGEETNVNKTETGQIAIYIPKGQHNILVKYCDPYFEMGCYMVLIFLLSVVACIIWGAKPPSFNFVETFRQV